MVCFKLGHTVKAIENANISAVLLAQQFAFQGSIALFKQFKADFKRNTQIHIACKCASMLQFEIQYAERLKNLSSADREYIDNLKTQLLQFQEQNCDQNAPNITADYVTKAIQLSNAPQNTIYDSSSSSSSPYTPLIEPSNEPSFNEPVPNSVELDYNSEYGNENENNESWQFLENILTS